MFLNVTKKPLVMSLFERTARLAGLGQLAWKSLLVQVLFLPLALLLSACDSPGDPAQVASKPATQAAPPAAAAPGPAATALKSVTGPCREFAAKICAKFTRDSPLCTSTETAVRMLAPEACQAALARFSEVEVKAAGLGARCKEFASKLCAEVGEASDMCKSTREKISKLPVDRCGAMMQNYGAILSALRSRAGH